MKKYLKQILAIVLFIGVFFIYGVDSQALEDGIYKLSVSLIKKYEDELSMGNPAIVQEGFLKVKGNKAIFKMRFIPMKAFDFTGYLGEFTVKGEPVHIINTYDRIDQYNDPKTGTDERMKGKKYIKDLEFPINIGEVDFPVHVYVPVMGEMASGDQDARLRISWPTDYKTFKVASDNFDGQVLPEEKVEDREQDIDSIYSSKDNRNLPELEKGEALKLEDGFYNVDIKLWHEREDRPSMGNGAIVQTAEIYVKDGKQKMLLGSDKMEVQNIVASLVSLQIRDDNAYYHFAEPYGFDLEIRGEKEKRAEVFEFDINRMDPYIYVKVDPKVKPMGEIPVGARLKIDWNSLVKIEEKDATLYNKMIHGTPRKEFNPNETIEKKSDNLVLIVGPGCFDENIRFKYGKVNGGKKYRDFLESVGRTTKLEIYEIKVENEYGVPLKPNKPVKLLIPIDKKIKDVVYLKDKSKIKFKVIGNNIELSLDKFGDIVLIFDTKKPQVIGKIDKKKPIKKLKPTKKTVKKEKKELKKEKKIKKEEKEAKKKTPTILTNEKDDFKNESTEVQGNLEEKKDEKIIYKENPKVIFFSIIFLLGIIGGGIYIHLVYLKKLMYEARLDEELKRILEKRGI